MPEESEALKEGRRKFQEAKNLCQVAPDQCHRIVAKQLCNNEKDCTTGAYQQAIDEQNCLKSCHKITVKK
jgi:hypothetical protein